MAKPQRGASIAAVFVNANSLVYDAGTSMKNILVLAACLFLAACSFQTNGQAGTSRVTVFEGARLITGDGRAPIENSAFVAEGNLFTRVGRRGEIAIPAGAQRVNLTGKTVMPAHL